MTIDPVLQPYVALAILVLAFGAFVLERFPPAVIAWVAAICFLLLDFVSTSEIMAVFSNPAPVTIAALFILSGALVRTGTLEWLAGLLTGWAGERPLLAIGALLIATVIASAFINNTPVVIVLIPIVMRLAGVIGISPSRLLIPVSYCAVLGGTCTLIGTSTNILVDGVATAQGMQPFGIFEITPVGMVVALAGLVTLLLIGRFVLPDRPAVGDLSTATLGSGQDYLTELAISEGSPFAERQLGDIGSLGQPGIRPLAVIRRNQAIRSGLVDQVLQPGDRLVLLAPVSEILTLRETAKASVGAKQKPGADGEERIVAEALVAPTRTGVSRTLADSALPARFGIRPLAVHRHGHIPGRDLASVRLRPADVVLLEGTPASLSALAAQGEFIAVGKTRTRPFRRSKAPIVIAALAATVALAAFDVMPIGGLALIAATMILLTRCIDLDEAVESIDGGVLLLIFGMLAVGQAMDNTGAIALVVAAAAPLLEVAGPLFLLIGLYAITSMLTEAVTNNAVAVIMTPIAISLATELGVDPRALAMVVMFGASASFATPIGYQTNTLVYGAGNYRFSDFLKIGVPMNIIVGLVTCAAIMLLVGL